jgi:hypothetical protein
MDNMMYSVVTKLALTVRCPICGAAPGKRCELSFGGFRFTSHRDRELSAIATEKARIRTRV